MDGVVQRSTTDFVTNRMADFRSGRAGRGQQRSGDGREGAVGEESTSAAEARLQEDAARRRVRAVDRRTGCLGADDLPGGDGVGERDPHPARHHDRIPLN